MVRLARTLVGPCCPDSELHVLCLSVTPTHVLSCTGNPDSKYAVHRVKLGKGYIGYVLCLKSPGLYIDATLLTTYLQFHAVVGVLTEDTDPMVSVMKLEKAPDETYADIGGLDQQIQEIKVCTCTILHVLSM